MKLMQSTSKTYSFHGDWKGGWGKIRMWWYVGGEICIQTSSRDVMTTGPQCHGCRYSAHSPGRVAWMASTVNWHAGPHQLICLFIYLHVCPYYLPLTVNVFYHVHLYFSYLSSVSIYCYQCSPLPIMAYITCRWIITWFSSKIHLQVQ